VSAPEDVQRLAGERADARAAKDFALADELRDRIRELGWEVTDQPGGFALQPVSSEVDGPVRPADVPSLLEADTTFEVSVHWVCEGWLDDIDRALAGFRATAEDRGVEVIEGARARRCRVAVDGDTFVAAVPQVRWLVGDADLHRWRGQLDYWVFLDGQLGRVAGSVNGNAAEIKPGALQGTIELRLAATDRDRDLVIQPPRP